MKDFMSFLTEDGAAVGSPAAGGANVAGGAQNYESPIGTEQPTAGRIGTAKRRKDGIVIPLPKAPDAPKIQEDYKFATREFLRNLGSEHQNAPKFEIPNLEYSMRMNRATHLNLSDYVALANDLGANGISVHATDPNPKSLKPTQRNFDWQKVNSLKDATAYLDPIVISQDGYVIDGHHRWLAACMDDAPIISAREIKLGIDDALEWLKDKDYPRNRDKITEAEKYVPGAGMLGGASDEDPDEYELVNGEWMPKNRPKVTPYKNQQKNYTNYASPKIQHNHQVTFTDKDEAKAEGMRWDPTEKTWFHQNVEKSKTSKFPYVKTVSYDKVDAQGQKVNRSEWVRPAK